MLNFTVGKTKTITELVRSILQCTEMDVVVLSERNGAIDAIAEKMAHDCIDLKRMNVKDVSLWNCVLAFGSSGMGSFSRLFKLEDKLRYVSTSLKLRFNLATSHPLHPRYHPELQELQRVIDLKRKVCNSLKKEMTKRLSNCIENLEGQLPDETNPEERARQIREDRVDLGSGSSIVATLKEVIQDLEDFVAVGERNLEASDVDRLIKKHDSVLGHLIPFPGPKEELQRAWRRVRPRTFRAMVIVSRALSTLTESGAFSLKPVEDANRELTQAEDAFRAAQERIKTALTTESRVLLATIGSSHKLNLSVEDEDASSENLSRVNKNTTSTIFIFDEAGCIPAFELLGLSRLHRRMEALVCVGDKHQLPPFDPGSGNFSRKNPHGSRSTVFRSDKREKLKSLLDASSLEPDNGKIRLTTQYRVPRDIAGILNSRVYGGLYQSAETCKAPLAGFKLIHVAQGRHHQNKKYVNENEIHYCVELIRASMKEGFDSFMVLTPVSSILLKMMRQTGQLLSIHRVILKSIKSSRENSSFA